jgi:putative O-methyltransferase
VKWSAQRMSKNTFKNYESSAEKINYLIRPAKQVERKLIIETLRSLGRNYKIEDYFYVGMGSLFYVDYKMLHKYLGIKSMISFEKEEKKIKRFDFNKPYQFINLMPGISTDILPSLDWEKDYIIWLDYDMPISMDIINDIQIVSNYIKDGGILIITLDAKVERFDIEFDIKKTTKNQARFENFKESLHPFYPSDITKKDLASKNFPLLLHKIISNALNEKILLRDTNFYQIFNFLYKDSSLMYTFGCVFDKSPKAIEKTGIYNYDFISKDQNLIAIDIPIITPLEKLHFDKLIPNIYDNLTDFEMDKRKLEDYEKYYKYYPQYFETYL